MNVPRTALSDVFSVIIKPLSPFIVTAWKNKYQQSPEYLFCFSMEENNDMNVSKWWWINYFLLNNGLFSWNYLFRIKAHPHHSISLELCFHRSFPPYLIFICLYIFLFVQILLFPWKLQGGGHSNTINTYISSRLILAIPPLSKTRVCKRTWFIYLLTHIHTHSQHHCHKPISIFALFSSLSLLNIFSI